MSHEQVGIGGGHTGAHGRTFDLEEMSGVEGEVVVGKETFTFVSFHLYTS